MKRLAIVVTVLLCAIACERRTDPAGGPAKAPSDLPDGMKLMSDPADKTLKPGQKAKVWVENNTGKKFTFDWSTEGHCGDFEVEKTKGLEVFVTGGKFGADCAQKVLFKASGTSGIFKTSLDIVVKGSPEFLELELRPNPMPESWVMVNDFETSMEPREVKCTVVVGGQKRPAVGLAFGADKKKKEGDASKGPEPAAGDKPQEIEESYDGVILNKLDAPFGPWNYEFGMCETAEPPQDEKGAFALGYDLPHDDSYCGYFETFKMGKDCEAAPFDVAPYERVTFLVKSGDGAAHRIWVELVAWEKYAEFHQGRTESLGPFEVPMGKWKRYEVELSDLVKDALTPSSIKSVSFKVTREKQADSGVILFDNIALIKGASK